MTTKLQPVRGTKDILPEEYRLHHYVISQARRVLAGYGFQEMVVPIFEFTEVFKRTLGDTSDIVSKEMYTFEDRGGESITLRPEATAGIARAFISNGLSQHVPCKMFTVGPQFRYERPQKGRYRQFHQVSVELLGAKEPQADVEMMALGYQLLSSLGVDDKVTLELNSLGDAESRQAYRTLLIEYFSDHKQQLSEESVIRLEKNPLRILDSKDEGDKQLVAHAPALADAYTAEAKEFFAEVKEGLERLAIPYVHNSRLVRGLDYYCHTAFEFTTTALGAQNAVLAGGRYDQLIKLMGGVETPSIGFAAGIERLVALVDASRAVALRPIALIPIGKHAEQEAQKLAYMLRQQGFVIELAYSGNVGKRMKKANKANACAALIMGEDELSSGHVVLRDMDQGQEERVAFDNVIDSLAQYR